MTNAHSIDTSVSKQDKTKSFIVKARAVHGDRYSYNRSLYTTSKKHLIVTCHKHGDFKVTPERHYSGVNCKLCSIEGARLTKEQFVERAVKKHGNTYSYELVKCIGNSRSKVDIVCAEHGKFTQTIGAHLAGSGCQSCARSKQGLPKKTSKQFIKESIAVHGNTYDYSLVDYVGSKFDVKIVCKNHGLFLQTPCSHLAGRGCHDCGIEQAGKSRAFSNDEFKAIATEVHGAIYDYSLVDYKNSNSVLEIVCSKHGLFSQNAHMHLQGQGCNRCGKESMAAIRSTPFDEFVKRANNTHSGRYTYNKDTYIRMSAKTEITCHEHGVFIQGAGEHVIGQGCPECALLSSGFGLSSFKNSCDRNNRGDGKLYVIEFMDNDVLAYKIGITSRTVKARFTATHFLPYEYQTLYLIEGGAEFVFNLERRLHNLLKQDKYKPSKWFAGETECFTTIKPIEKLLKELSNTEQLQLLA